MKEFKALLVCVIPFVVAAALVFPFLAIIGGGLDPFVWERNDRLFYFICTGCFGSALLVRLLRVGVNDE